MPSGVLASIADKDGHGFYGRGRRQSVVTTCRDTGLLAVVLADVLEDLAATNP
jgi:hypothetical protein